MKLTIEIKLDNAAFEDGGTEEIARILADMCEQLPDPLTTRIDYVMRDANGNTVGKARIK